MNIKFSIVMSADSLPEKWNQLAVHYFQRIPFLQYLEQYNPCKQRYYMMYQNDDLQACAVIYTLPLDLLTFARIKSPVKMHIVGVPCSVSSPGIFGEPEAIKLLKPYIAQREKGLLLLLNLDKKPVETKNATGNTLPTIVLENRFASWQEYVDSLRADYRRRLLKILSNKEISLETRTFGQFTEQMYDQYLQVFKKSNAKLEKLNHDFFRNLPQPFRLTACLYKQQVIGWNITVHDGDYHYFFLGGIDYSYNREFSTYFQLLSNIIKDGIEQKAKYIDLGQTAEIPKMRMGGRKEARFMEAHHHFALINVLLKKGRKLLEYSRKVPPANVFKN